MKFNKRNAVYALTIYMVTYAVGYVGVKYLIRKMAEDPYNNVAFVDFSRLDDYVTTRSES